MTKTKESNTITDAHGRYIVYTATKYMDPYIRSAMNLDIFFLFSPPLGSVVRLPEFDSRTSDVITTAPPPRPGSFSLAGKADGGKLLGACIVVGSMITD